MATCTFWVFDIWTLFKSMCVALYDTALRQEGGLLITARWRSKFRFPIWPPLVPEGGRTPCYCWADRSSIFLLGFHWHQLAGRELGYCSPLASTDNTGKGWRVGGGLGNAGSDILPGLFWLCARGVRRDVWLLVSGGSGSPGGLHCCSVYVGKLFTSLQGWKPLSRLHTPPPRAMGTPITSWWGWKSGSPSPFAGVREGG